MLVCHHTKLCCCFSDQWFAEQWEIEERFTGSTDCEVWRGCFRTWCQQCSIPVWNEQLPLDLTDRHWLVDDYSSLILVTLWSN